MRAGTGIAINSLTFLAAVVLLQQSPALCPSPWLYVLGAVMLVGASLTKRRWPLVFFTAGLLLAHYDAQRRIDDRLLEALQGTDITVEGVVASLPEIDTHSVRFTFDVLDSPVRLPAHLRLSWYYPEQTLEGGQRWRFTVRLKRPHGSLNPGGFDYERWLLLQNVGATGYVRNSQQTHRLGDGGAAYTVLRWRQQLANKLATLCPESGNFGLIKALTLGDGQSVSQKQWELFRQTGTVHLMVISGSHIALVAGWAYFVARRLWVLSGCLRISPQSIGVAAALAAGVFYALLAGLAIPVQRAVVMALAGLLTVLLQRRSSIGRTIALAALLVVALQPVAVLAPGFWLSFAAVGLIAYALGGRLRQPRSLMAGLKIQWAVSLGLTPLLLLFFQQASLLSLPANFIAIPLIGFVAVPLALSAVMLLPVYPPLSRWLLEAADLCLHVLTRVLNVLVQLPHVLIAQSQPEPAALIAAAVGAAILLAPRGVPKRWLGAVLWLPLLFPLREQIANGAVKLTLLDVGQGLSAVLQTSRHNMVFDTGAKLSDDFDMGQSVLLPYLRLQGIDKLDMVIVSHDDNDHSGGLEAVLQAVKVGRLSAGGAETVRRFAAEPCLSGQNWQWDGVTFTILSPREGGYGADNDNSCVLKVESRYGSILLPGDIEAGAEAWLAETFREKLRADILVAPHHGSNTSSTPTFLQPVNPRYILIPAGFRNRFGFPHAQVLQRYRKSGAAWLSSAAAGAITVWLSGSGRQVEAYRQNARHYWNE